MTALLDQGPPQPPITVIDRRVNFDSGIFVDYSQAAFYVGLVAAQGEVFNPELNAVGHQLRANVYIDELGYLPSDARGSDGGERDEDDARSFHFLTVENRGFVPHVRASGITRSILKPSVDAPLPIEHLFPEAFDEPLPEGNVEASRFIARHPEARVQRAIALGNIRSVFMHAAEIEAPGVFAVVEPFLTRYFRSLGMPLTVLSGLKVLTEYGDTENHAISFDTKAVVQTALSAGMKDKPLGKFFRDADQDAARGYYDASLENRINS